MENGKIYVNTVEQYKILQFIKENFVMDFITIKLMGSSSIKVMDMVGDSLVFTLQNGSVVAMGRC